MKKMMKIGIALLISIMLITPVFTSYAEPIYSDNLIPQMTGATTPSGIVSASTIKSGFYAWHAFDRLSNAGNNLHDWAATTIVSWIQYEFPTQKTVAKYTIKSSYAVAATPTAWTFEGSNDGINWQVLDTRSGESWSAGQVKAYTFSNSNPFNIYRLNISANGGHGFTVISEIEMMELIGEVVSVPDAPVNLVATGGNTLVNLSWTEVADADTYNVKRSETLGGPYTSIATSVIDATYNDTSVVNGITYFYIVTAVNTSGESNASNEVSATPQVPVVNDYTGGLLDGKTLQVGNHLLYSSSTTTLATDNNEATGHTMGAHLSSTDALWFLLDEPTSINAVKIKSSGLVTFYLLDSSGNVIYQTTGYSTDGALFNFSAVDNVARVGIGNITSSVHQVYEFNVYESPQEIPAPLNLIATGGNGEVDLQWDSVAEAEKYNLKRSLTPGGPYTLIQQDILSTTFIDANVTNGETYYYVVTAVNAQGESVNSNEAFATPQGNSVDRAILVVTLVSGLEKEYDLTMAEVNAFIDWYDNRAAGTGPERYEIEKDYNKGPFTSRKDNLVFDKIMTFEVMEYNAVQ